jgi:hypothetical protein
MQAIFLSDLRVFVVSPVSGKQNASFNPSIAA